MPSYLCGHCGSGRLEEDEYGDVWCRECRGLVKTHEQREKEKRGEA